MGRSLSEAQVAEILRLYRTGKGVLKVSARTGHTTDTVRRYVHAAGIMRPPAGNRERAA